MKHELLGLARDRLKSSGKGFKRVVLIGAITIGLFTIGLIGAVGYLAWTVGGAVVTQVQSIPAKSLAESAQQSWISILSSERWNACASALGGHLNLEVWLKQPLAQTFENLKSSCWLASESNSSGCVGMDCSEQKKGEPVEL